MGCNRLYLVLNLGLPLRIIESFCLVQLLPQIVEPVFVLCFSLCVQQWDAGIESVCDESIRGDCCSRGRYVHRAAGEQFLDMELTSRIAKQDGEILQAARVSKQCSRAP